MELRSSSRITTGSLRMQSGDKRELAVGEEDEGSRLPQRRPNATPRPRLGPILDQGVFGTCVPHALGSVLQNNAFAKYSIPLDEQQVVNIIRCQSPDGAWQGMESGIAIENWNAKFNSPRSSIMDVSKRNRYNFRLDDVEKHVKFDLALEKMKTLQNFRLAMLVTITIKCNEEEGLHALFVDAVYPNCLKMLARNSWGSADPTWEGTPENFVDAHLTW